MESRPATLSTSQLVLLSTGSMLGAGWLFSPYLGVKAAGIGVMLSWLIAAGLSLVIALTIAEVCRAFPLVGGVYRMFGITHSPCTAATFLVVGWLSYAAFLPIEAQSVTQYLGFWFPSLVVEHAGHAVALSWRGLGVAAGLVLGLSAANTLAISVIARANTVVTIWKIGLPLLIAAVAIAGFGHWSHVVSPANREAFSAENVLHAVTASGLAFAFSGFQNGVVLAHRTRDPERALRLSLVVPMVGGLVIYGMLSMAFLACAPEGSAAGIGRATAPLMGLLSLLGLNAMLVLLFADAVLAPLGTANVYVAVTARVLYALGREWKPDGWLARLNRQRVPYVAVWGNALLGLMFLLPLPSWAGMVSFLSSLVVFAFLAGPVSLLVLTRRGRALQSRGGARARVLGVAGFLCCTWMVYWSGRANLAGLTAVLAAALGAHVLLRTEPGQRWRTWIDHAYLPGYAACLTAVAVLREHAIVAFPWDELLIGGLGLVFCALFVARRAPDEAIDRGVAAARDEQRTEVAG